MVSNSTYSRETSRTLTRYSLLRTGMSTHVRKRGRVWLLTQEIFVLRLLLTRACTTYSNCIVKGYNPFTLIGTYQLRIHLRPLTSSPSFALEELRGEEDHCIRIQEALTIYLIWQSCAGAAQTLPSMGIPLHSLKGIICSWICCKTVSKLNINIIISASLRSTTLLPHNNNINSRALCIFLCDGLR